MLMTRFDLCLVWNWEYDLGFPAYYRQLISTLNE
jgi:hypothetical protein